MSVSSDDIVRVARLAELAVDEAELPALAAQMDRIVRFVAQLGELDDLEDAPPFIAGPEQVLLRPDLPQPGGLSRLPATFAPEFIDGFFVVPRLGGLEES
jgi:aspartyl-tRNA(Asn)/glutamyl-tRNA(Gln) amidotransferase subunit C